MLSPSELLVIKECLEQPIVSLLCSCSRGGLLCLVPSFYGACWCYVGLEISWMLKEHFIGDLSFWGKVSLDSCPKGGSFSSRSLFWVALHLFFHLTQEPCAPRPLHPKLDQRDLQCFLGQTRHEYQKGHSSKSNMDWIRKQGHLYTSWIACACIWDWARQGIAVFYGKTCSCFFHLPVFKVLLLLAKHQATYSQKWRVRFL